MKRIYTQCFSINDADNLGHFIMGYGYEGVQNDSYRYCLLMIKMAFEENLKHYRNYCFIGVNGYRLVVGKSKKDMRRDGSYHFIEKEKFFRDKLDKMTEDE